MKKVFSICLFALCWASLSSLAANRTVKFKVLETTDVHGCYLPYDFINQRPAAGSLARVYTYVCDAREEYGDRLILLDAGDILQGQPIAYYYNYIVPDKENIVASVTNFMGYDAQAFGNHDIETGHAVYDKWATETLAPVMGANMIDNVTGDSYAPAYCILERDGVRIAVIGMITPAIPNWLSENLWSGMHFEDIKESAKKWVAYIKENEKPDVILGLFHSGKSGGITTSEYSENESLEVAQEVDGFDAILFGHDHMVCCEKITNNFGHDVWLLNPANNAMNVAELNIDVTIGDDEKKSVTFAGRIVDVRDMPVDNTYMQQFEGAEKEVRSYTEREIGTLTETLYTSDCFFGSSPLTDFINEIQLELTSADISFSAPLQFNAVIGAGILRVADMFNIYKFENLLYTILLSGHEIKDYLEMSYALWTNTMTSPGDHIMLIEERQYNGRIGFSFINPTFNFDSALGIDYEVDVTRPVGEKVIIKGMSDGRPFDMNATYKVAMNSYRANNGGELLTKGAKIPKEEIPQRIIWQSDRDLRYYIMQYIEQKKIVSPAAVDNWQFVPEDWACPALERDRKLIFGK